MFGLNPLWLQVLIFAGDAGEARAVLRGVQVAMTDNQRAGVALVQLFEQRAHGLLLFSRPRIGGLTADIQTALVADAYRVAVVVQAVGANHPFRTAFFDLSVTTDDVVITDTELPVVILSVPTVDLCRRTRLVRPHRTAMNND